MNFVEGGSRSSSERGSRSSSEGGLHLREPFVKEDAVQGSRSSREDTVRQRGWEDVEGGSRSSREGGCRSSTREKGRRSSKEEAAR